MNPGFSVCTFGGVLLCLQLSSAYIGFSHRAEVRGPFRHFSFGDSSHGMTSGSRVSLYFGPSSRTRTRSISRFGSSPNGYWRVLGSSSGGRTFRLGNHGSYARNPNLSPASIDVDSSGSSSSENTGIKTEDYFKSAQDIPMKLYNTVVCAVFKKPTNLPEARCPSYSSEVTWARFIIDLKCIRCGYHANPYRHGEKFSHYALRKVKTMLYGGVEQEEEQNLKRALLNRLNVKDLNLIFSRVYGPMVIFAEIARERLRMFYVSSPESTIDRLVDKDRKRLLVDLILAVNRKLLCPVCRTMFYTVDQIVTAVSERLLPRGLAHDKKIKALKAIKFISEAKLTSDKVSKLLGNLANGYQEGSLDVEMTCTVLGHAKATSYYCGVRESAWYDLHLGISSVTGSRSTFI
ncbi:hypothetical protein ElyMa_006310000 [Elysia marginata]|uniref:Uncharacterized protein n=1 Tax=Elysia marginata TaxID=1093978 RepID=A0AAV4HGU2_9GAST|nr:hypothetical protein ElyMa_006310000 [Elysia marginata]